MVVKTVSCHTFFRPEQPIRGWSNFFFYTQLSSCPEFVVLDESKPKKCPYTLRHVSMTRRPRNCTSPCIQTELDMRDLMSRACVHIAMKATCMNRMKPEALCAGVACDPR